MESNLKLIESSSLAEARSAAYEEASATHKNVVQVMLFTQGNRICASGTMQLGRALQIMSTDPVAVSKKEKASIDLVRNAYNRPVNKDHVKAVSDYLTNNVTDTYILPSITVNAVKEQKVFTTDNDGVRLGYMVIDFMSVDLTVTDGQHRLGGVRSAVEYLEQNGFEDEAEKLKSDGIAIMFSFESDKDQIHQDFADCSKTKALPKSMIAVYDKRIPVNKLTMDIIDHCRLYNDGRVDTASKSLGGTSTAFALASNVRGALKCLYTGNASMADDAFDNLTNKELIDLNVYTEFYERSLHYLNLLIDNNQVLSSIASLPKGPSRQDIPKYRYNTFIANPAGINLCCVFIHELINNKELSDNEKDSFVIRLATEIDWSKGSEAFKGSVVSHKDELDKNGNPKYAIVSTNAAVKKAIDYLKNALGYKAPDSLF
ncbi:DNA sulfur modification protein DndB [Vibrio fluminensis]|uniref:DNA sulfur modification protein DndB n=1 Tax=Vibrio fluminensis TaxID=2783614 RepID=UPI0018877FB1|nr:DNA sulfur modification protein DndB [Vibrio fluminensis]